MFSFSLVYLFCCFEILEIQAISNKLIPCYFKFRPTYERGNFCDFVGKFGWQHRNFQRWVLAVVMSFRSADDSLCEVFVTLHVQFHQNRI